MICRFSFFKPNDCVKADLEHLSQPPWELTLQVASLILAFLNFYFYFAFACADMQAHCLCLVPEDQKTVLIPWTEVMGVC